jgi:hypothetical protein
MSAAANRIQQPVSNFAGTLMDLLDRVEYRRVEPQDTFDPVYRLRYEAYRREEFIPVNSAQLVHDEFDALPNAYCFGVYIDGQLVSSVRFHHLTSEFRGSPSHSVFGDVLDPVLDGGATLLDPGRFTADYAASLAFPALPYLTLRIPTMAVWHFNVRYCLSSVRPEHAPFYRRVYRSVQWASERMYRGLSFPMVLYACEIPVIYPDLLRRYPFFRSTREERESLFGTEGKENGSAVRPTARWAPDFPSLAEEPA